MIGECNLIFLRLTCERLRLFAAELRGEFGAAAVSLVAAARLAARSRSASKAVFAAPMLCCVIADCSVGVKPGLVSSD